jgi:putative thiamine transport system permease protein
VIAYATSVVDVAIVLGPTTPAPLAVRLVTWMGEPDLAMRLVASAGAVLQLGVTLLALLLWHLGERTANALCRAMAERGTRMARADRALAGASALPMTLAVVTIGSGIAVLALWSVAGPWFFPDALPQRLTLETWIRQGSMVARPLAISLAVGAAAAGIATLLVIACLANELVRARRPGRAAMILLYLPLIIPQVAFLFGLQILLIATGLDASFGALVAAHLVFVIPYVFLSLSDPWRGFDSRYEQAAAALGAGSWRRLVRVRLPMLTRPILTAAAVGFAVSVGLYLPTLLVAAGRLPTIATEAVALASGGDRRLLGVYALLQAVLPFIGFWIALAVPAMAFRHRNAMALP